MMILIRCAEHHPRGKVLLSVSFTNTNLPGKLSRADKHNKK